MLLKINFEDFWHGFNKEDNYFINILKRMYGEDNVKLSPNPDYLFFSCFGFKNLKYNCVKIFFTGENIVPDFNLCDYAIGVHNIQFRERYFRLPFYMLYSAACQKAMDRHMYSDDYYLNRKFCSYVISNSLGAPERMKIIEALEKYKALDSGGRWNNNVGAPVRNKIEFVSQYKFTICFENSAAKGYTTEKLVEGFAGGCVPIYWGNCEIASEFNSNAFVNCNDFKTLEDAVEYIIRLDQNDELYLNMVRESIFTKEQKDFETIQRNLENFLRTIFEHGVEKQINNLYVGKRYVDRMRFFRKAFSAYRLYERIVSYKENYANMRKGSNR